jgi:hypothetical protein
MLVIKSDIFDNRRRARTLLQFKKLSIANKVPLTQKLPPIVQRKFKW